MNELTNYQKSFLEEILDFGGLDGLCILRSVREFLPSEKKDIKELIKLGIITKTPQEVCNFYGAKQSPKYDYYKISENKVSEI